jgi:transmembrane sensor
MDIQRAQELLDKHQAGTLTPEEKLWLDRWYLELEASQPEVDPSADLIEKQKQVFARIDQAIRPRTIRLWPRVAAAASLLIGISIAAYFALHQQPNPQIAQAKHDVAPFSKLAVLKTGHGKTIILDNTHKGALAQYANTQIQKTGGDQIAYNNSDSKATEAIFDTLQVPAGGKPYHLKLADGSAVILNVASTLRYPENFRHGSSAIELISGEAYFTIIHNPGSPVTIAASHQLISDIGTEFNVNTYNDEPESHTTLVEGAVTVNHHKLNPGQQAVITANNVTVAGANLLQVTAWKEGYFRFNGEKIQAVMRELSRWYNIDVKYEGKVPDVGYYVKISRSKNISEVLKALERTNSVHFKIEGRRITVLSKK